MFPGGKMKKGQKLVKALAIFTITIFGNCGHSFVKFMKLTNKKCGRKRIPPAF